MCKFCEKLTDLKLCDKWSNKSRTEEDKERLGRRKSDYSVAIIHWHWWEKRKKWSGGRTTVFRRQGVGFKLNYCPECGRDLRRRKKGEKDMQEL